jgi:hypothetical protein
MTCIPELTQVALTTPQILSLLRVLTDLLRAAALMLGAVFPYLTLAAVSDSACPRPDMARFHEAVLLLPADDAALVRAYFTTTAPGDPTL